MKVVPQQDSIDVFVNADNLIVIEQANPMGDDPYVVVLHPQHVEALVRALRATKRETMESAPNGH